MKNSSKANVFLLAFLALAGVASVLWALAHYAGIQVGSQVLAGSRWAALLAFCAYAFLRRSLTAWIFAGMLVGVEVGYHISFLDKEVRERIATDVQVLSTIFLRLIKTII